MKLETVQQESFLKVCNFLEDTVDEQVLLSDLQKEMTKFCYDLYSEREID
jgi:hypothetical protein